MTMIIRSMMALAMIAAFAAPPAMAQGQANAMPTAMEIVERLAPKKQKVRGWSATRGIAVEEAEPVDPKKHTIDLTVNFGFDSATLTPDALSVLDSLGAALSDEKLKDYRFEVAGHTDARGLDSYNRQLSEARAEAVKAYLVQRYRVSPARLSTIGYGEARLLVPDQPENGANRRVQVSNLGAQ